jgi:hypothetical protein
MDQTVLFVLFLLSLLIGWFGGRGAAVTLFLVTLVLGVADFLHHATSTLTLSF